MAEEVQIPGAGTPAKIRNIIAVPVLAIITLGVYLVVWWYKINREMADLGRARGTDELGDSPGKSTLALFPGALIIVPAIWTTITTFQRVQKAQKLSGQGLNGIWHSIGIAPVAPSAMPAAAEESAPAAIDEPAPPAPDEPAA